MTALTLPPPIAAYFAADSAHPAAVARCFAPKGSVTDEGRTHTGRAAIEAWKADAAARYTYRTEPFALHEDSGCQIVESHVAGDFPGSPVDLRYRFCLDGALIASLEITA